MTRNKITQEDREKFYKDIAPIAIRERNRLFKDNDLSNEINVLEQLGFIIVKFPSKDKKLSGFCIEKSGYKCIYINSNTSLGRQRFSLWHEYYHLITGDGIGISYDDELDYNESECRAHLFSSLFIMPENIVRNCIENKNINMPFIKNVDILDMANKFRVSFSAMLYRIIQIYPEYGNDLRKRFGFANNEKKLRDFAINNNLSITYETITKDFYINKIFFEQIEKNFKEKKINDEKISYIKQLLDMVKDNIND